jgi:NAD+ kinase
VKRAVAATGNRVRSAIRVKSAPRVLVIYKKSAYQIYISERRNSRVQQLLSEGDRTVLRLVRAHKDHTATMEAARSVLAQLGAKAVFRYRSDPASADEHDLVITLGGDGTLLWASHSVGQVPMLAINTAPRDSVGYFCAGDRNNLGDVLADALRAKLPATRLTRMRVALDDEVVSTRVLNDILFAHECPAATTRYTLMLGREREEQKSSGVWVGPGEGSTAAQASAGGKAFSPGAAALQFVAREPYIGAGAQLRMRRGMVEKRQTLRIKSGIRAGRLYVDGPHLARVVDIGSVLSLDVSKEPLTLLGFQHIAR